MLLIVVGPEAAGQILKNFEDHEIEMVCKEIKLSHVPRDLQERILEDLEIIGDSLKGLLVGMISPIRLWKLPAETIRQIPC